MKIPIKALSWIVFSIVSTTIIILLYLTYVLLPVEHIFYDSMFKLRGPIKAKNDIVIVKIDEESLSTLGRWPWNRKIIAKTVENLFNAGVKIVGLDILFVEPSNKESDLALKSALAKGNSVIVSHFEYVYENVLKDGKIQKVTTEKLIYPIDLFHKTAKVGFANVEPDEDGVIRSVLLYKEYEGKQYKSFNYIIAENFLGTPLKNIPQKIYVNYYGPSEFVDKKTASITSTFISYSFKDIYYNIIPPSWLKNKIVLIGATAVGTYDHYPTPFVKMFPGVELHATVIENLLSQTYCTVKFTKKQNILLLLVLSTVFCILFYISNASVTIIFVIVFTIGYYFITYFTFTKSFLILEYTPYSLITIILGFGSIFYKLLYEQQEKKIIKSVFSKYINPYVMEELLSNPESSLSMLGGQKREITVVFTDIRNFTTLSEKLPAEEVVKFLNQYFQIMNNIIFKYNGTIDKYIGDSIMFFWNAPVEQKDHAYLAVCCVIEMFKELEKFNEYYHLPVEFQLKIGAGINTGEAVVGNIGSQHMMEYTAVGDTVNTASRLQALTKELNSPIIISEFVNNKLNNRIPTKSLGKIKLRGKEQEIEIFGIEGFSYY